MTVAQGGHSADEIRDAFRDVYEEVVLIALTVALRRSRAREDA